MGNSLFVANVDLKENEGIYKKINSQADSLAKLHEEGFILLKSGKGSKYKKCLSNELFENNSQSVLSNTMEIIKSKKISTVYFRHMLPSIKLIFCLARIKRRKVDIFYEIPTYPYFAEQYRTAVKKYRAIVKIVLDIIFWPLIYLFINHLVIIRSNTKAKKYKKMVEISNGVDISNIESKSYELVKNNKMRMVAVGTLYEYHGYDRIIKGLMECEESILCNVEFHIVGESPTIEKLKNEVAIGKIKNVYFHGVKNTFELNKLYDKFDIGLGCLALHRRGADIDTTIKIIEYYARGIPVVTSGISPMDKINSKFTYHVDNEDSPISIEKIYNYYINLSIEDKKMIANYARKYFTWDSIVRSMIDETR